MNELTETGYPYEITVLRYNIGSDNGPPDVFLADAVKDWNEKYITPKIVISTVSEAFSVFEEKYGDKIPEVKGDFTGYWEDGSLSSAKETVINRSNAVRLVLGQALWSVIDPSGYPDKEYSDTWQKVMLYDEHTWGSWNSVSEPEAEFTQQQWKIKQEFALSAQDRSEYFVNNVLEDRMTTANVVRAAEVINTGSYPKTDLVVLPGKYNLPGSKVMDRSGKQVPSQVLSSGGLAFLAGDIPPFGSEIFYIQEGEYKDGKAFSINENTLLNEKYDISVNPADGSIEKLMWKEKDTDLVSSGTGGLNDFFYVEGRSPVNKKKVDNIRISVKENGPLLTSLLIESDAPGCKKLTREIRLVNGLDRVDIINTIDKKKIYDQEGVHFGFPFNISDGTMRYDLAIGVCDMEKDQLPGACRNYITINSCVDISNEEYGITWASPDAPLVEAGEITTDAIAFGWIDSLEPTQTLYSYVMNNYWETNYCAAQEGQVTFRYSILPHQEYDQDQMIRFGKNLREPLIVVPVSKDQKRIESQFEIEDNGIIALSVKPVQSGRAFLLKLYNIGEGQKPLIWKKKPTEIYLCDPDGNIIGEGNNVIFPPFGIKMFLIKK